MMRERKHKKIPKQDLQIQEKKNNAPKIVKKKIETDEWKGAPNSRSTQLIKYYNRITREEKVYTLLKYLWTWDKSGFDDNTKPEILKLKEKGLKIIRNLEKSSLL